MFSTRDAAFAPKMTTSSSMMLMSTAAAASASALTSSASSSSLSAATASHQAAEQAVEAKELDHVLSEIALLLSRAETYFKFVKKRVRYV